MKLTVLNQNEEVVTVLSDDIIQADSAPLISAVSRELLNDADELTFETTADSVEAADIREDYYIVVKINEQYREYIIDSIVDADDTELIKKVTATLSSVELADDIVETAVSGTDPENVLKALLKGTRWTVGYVDPAIYDQKFTEDVLFDTVLSSIFTLVNFYNCDVHFSYDISGAKVVGRKVSLYKQLGADDGKRFEIGKDVTSVERTVDTTAIKTAIYPVRFSEDEDGNKIITDIADVVWTTAAGFPVNKPKGQKFIADSNALKQWGRLNADGTLRHRIKLYEFNEEVDAETMATMSWVSLGQYTQPKITYEAKVIDLYLLTGSEEYSHEKLTLGDTCAVIDRYFSVPIETVDRVIEIERDLLEPEETVVTLGTQKSNYYSDRDSVVSEAQQMADAAKNAASQKAQNALITANGKNKTTYGSIEPANPIENDSWVRPHPDYPQETQWCIWDGVQWAVEMDTREISEARKVGEDALEAGQAALVAGEEARKAGEEAKKAAADADALANKAKADSAAAIDSANKAVLAANDGKTTAESAKGIADQAKADAATAVSDAKKAKQDAEKSLADSSKSLVDSAKAIADAEKALTNVAGVQTNLTTEITRVEGLLNVKVSTTTFDALKKTVTDQGTAITQNANAIKLKANQSSVDTLSGRVTTAEGQITAQAGKIELKANKTEVDEIVGRVDSAESLLEVQGNQINLKASQTSVDSLSGRVTSAEGQINNHAGQIKLKANQTTVDSLTGRVTAAEGQLTIQGGQISAKASQSEVDTLSGKVSSNVAKLDVQSTAIAGLVTKTDGHATKIGSLELQASKFQVSISDLNDADEVISGQLQVLSDNINLKVSKDNVINMINVSSEGIQIVGQRLHITAMTWIDSAVIYGSHLVDSSITNAKIATAAIDTAKIRDLSVTDMKIANLAVTSAKIQDAAITNAKIANAAIDSAKIKDASITNAKIINIDAGKIVTGTLSAITISGVDITGSNFYTENIGRTFTMQLQAGDINFFNMKAVGAHFMGGLHAAVNAATKTPVGINLYQTNGYTLALGTGMPSDETASTAVFEIPANSNALSPKYTLRGEGSINGPLTSSYPWKITNTITANGIRGNTGQALWLSADSGSSVYVGIGGSSAAEFNSSRLYVWGSLSVTGSKNAAHITRDGLRATPAYETAESYLGDLGKAVTDADSCARIEIDELFSDTVNLNMDYHVFLSAYSNAKLWVSEMTESYFIVQSDQPDTVFSWELKAKRRGYESDRLVLQDVSFEEIKEHYSSF